LGGIVTAINESAREYWITNAGLLTELAEIGSEMINFMDVMSSR
jgi:hypothetical protein